MQESRTSMTFSNKALKKISDGVYQAQGSYVKLEEEHLKLLVEDAKTNKQGRARINFHPSPESQVHEMMIALDQKTKVNVHRHTKKSESFHVISGCLVVILFDRNSNITDEITLASKTPNCFYRLNEDIDHLVIPVSDCVLMHETTCGPFRKGDSKTPEWAESKEGLDKIESLRKHHISKFETVRQTSL